MHNDIDLSKFTIFITVADCLSFTEAAFLLYSTQSTVSKTISSLESSLGYPLLIRKNKKIALTKAGEYLYHAMKEKLSEINLILDEADRIYDGEIGKISIGFSGYLPKNPVFEMVSSSFFCEHPEYELDLKLMEYQSLKKQLKEEKIDAILFNDLDMTISENFHTLELMQNETILLYNPLIEKWAHKETLTIDDFKDANFICIRPSLVPGYQTALLRCCKAHHFTPNISKYADSVIEMVQYISNSQYVTILSKAIFPFQSSDLSTFTIPYKEGMPVLKSILAWREDHDNPALHLFTDYAENYLSKLNCKDKQ